MNFNTFTLKGFKKTKIIFLGKIVKISFKRFRSSKAGGPQLFYANNFYM